MYRCNMLCTFWSPSPSSRLGICLSFLAPIIALVSSTRLVKHDVDFLPDIVLRVTVEPISLNCQQRLSTLVNGTYPGPPIYLEPEQTTWIRVYNDADVNTTIHWHGLGQNLFPFSDGSPQASQWPIPPGHFFDYELYPPADMAGTLFYHSHVGFQAMTASGPLIVNDASAPPYPYDDELILFIGDFYPEEDEAIEAQLTAVPYTWTGDPSALQINGQSGNAPSSPQIPLDSPSDSSCQPYEFDVEPDTTYRVRVIGATAVSLVTFGIEDYDNLTIIETDSSYVYPVETDHIQVDSGQRFSFLLQTRSTYDLVQLGKTSSWIQFETRAGDGVVTAWAKLNYNTPTSEAAGPVARREQSHTSADSNPQPQPQPEPDPEPEPELQPQSASDESSFPTSPLPSPSPSPSPSSTQNANTNFIPSSPLIALPTEPTDISTWLEYTFRNLPRYGTAPSSSSVTRRIIISTGQILNQTTGNTLFPSNSEVWFDGASTPLDTPLGLDDDPTTPTPYLVEILGNGTINGSPPDLDRALANAASPGFDPLSHTYPARIGEVLEIVWQNSASQPGGVYGVHPMHAHGGPYWDMGSGAGEYSPEAHEALLLEAQAWDGTSVVAWNGSRRDTTMLYTYDSTGWEEEVNGWRVWRVEITAANVGVWMMHCHILQHMIMGQQTVWVFGTPEEIVANSAPVDGNLDGYFTYGGDVVGEAGSDGVTLVSKFP
ncbi:hypothetical protein LTR41_010060 [Exophiala xenobiotica]|nr:hypothetical protein LTR41_010060 [Exophiala xenobiotica]